MPTIIPPICEEHNIPMFLHEFPEFTVLKQVYCCNDDGKLDHNHCWVPVHHCYFCKILIVGYDTPMYAYEAVCDSCEIIFKENGYRHLFTIDSDELEILISNQKNESFTFCVCAKTLELYSCSSHDSETRINLDYFDPVDINSTIEKLNLLLLFS
jgi:hypothetical protein